MLRGLQIWLHAHHVKTLAMGPAMFYSQGYTAYYEGSINAVKPHTSKVLLALHGPWLSLSRLSL